MTTSAEIVLIGGVVDCLASEGSWCAETHIQKSIFVAKCAMGVPFESKFILYKHGPYSFDLNKSLNHMRSRRILEITPHEGYGPSFKLNRSMWSALNKAASDHFGKYSDGIHKACVGLAKKNVAELERVSTAVYVLKMFPEFSADVQESKLIDLKPHVTEEAAKDALNEAREIVG